MAVGDRLTGTFDISEFVVQERTSEFSGDTEYSFDGEYWTDSEEDALKEYKEREDPMNYNMIY